LRDYYKRVLERKETDDLIEGIDVTALINSGQGTTKTTFILPNGKPIGIQKGIGLPQKVGIKEVKLEAVKDDTGKIKLIFKAVTNEGKTVTSTRRWNGEELLPEKITADEIIFTLQKHKFNVNAACEELSMTTDENLNEYFARIGLSETEISKIVIVLLSQKTGDAAGEKNRGSSRGISSPGGKKSARERAQEELRAYYKKVLKRKETDDPIDDIDVTVLIHHGEGKTQTTFILPNGKSIAKQKGIGLPTTVGMQEVKLKAVKDEDGNIALIFKGVTKEGKKAESLCTWNGEKIKIEYRLNEEQINLRTYYKRVLERIDVYESIEDIEITSFVQSRQGTTQTTFILPNGKPIGIQKGIGLPTRVGIKEVKLEVVKAEDGNIELIFKVVTKDGRKAGSVCSWNGEMLEVEYILNEEQVVLRDYYKRVIERKETDDPIEDIDVTVFIKSRDGRTKRTFILPNGKPIEKIEGIRLPATLGIKEVKLEIVKDEEENLELIFKAITKEGRKAGSVCTWDREKLKVEYRLNEEQINLKDHYRRVFERKESDAPIGDIDVTALILSEYGSTQITFILPNGKPIGKNKGIGLPVRVGIKEVKLEVVKSDTGKIKLTFKALTNEGKTVTSTRRWNGEELLKEKITVNEVVCTLKKHEFKIDVAREELGMTTLENLNDYLARIGLSEEEISKVVVVLLSQETGDAVGKKNRGFSKGGASPGGKVLERKRAQTELKAYYKRVLERKETDDPIEDADVTKLVRSRGGTTQKTFILPNGKPILNQKGIGLPQTVGIREVKLEVVKAEGGNLELIFKVVTTQGRKAESVCTWNKEKLNVEYRLNEDQINLRNYYRKVSERKETDDLIDDIDVTAFIQSELGQTQRTFILPNGKPIGKQKRIGLLKELA